MNKIFELFISKPKPEASYERLAEAYEKLKAKAKSISDKKSWAYKFYNKKATEALAEIQLNHLKEMN